MNLGFFELEPWQKEVFRKAFPGDKLFFTDKKLTSANAQKFKNLEAASIFVYSRIDGNVLKHLPKLKLITTMSTGFDHIDLEECKKKGIKVANVPTYGENTVAEQAFALILALSRKIIASVEKTRKGRFDVGGLRGFDLEGRTLGVVGTGNIGRHAVKMGNGFGMKVIAFDVFEDKRFAKKMELKYVSLKKLFEAADIITLHVPYNKHTHHLVNQKLLFSMKKGSFLINTSRGGVVDTFALLKALRSGRLAGAGLDVLEEEDALAGKAGPKDRKILAASKELLKMRNVLITPHNAFNTKEALARILDTTIKNIREFKNKRAVNLVN